MKRDPIKVGFWKDTKALFDLSGYPDPRDLVDHDSTEEKREQIARYIDAGERVNAWLGSSYCRFGCTGVDMGSTDLSDGTYLWPQGLSHYIRVHHVRLPKHFTRHIIENFWRLKKAHKVESPEPGKEALLADAAKQLGEWVDARRKSKGQVNAQ